VPELLPVTEYESRLGRNTQARRPCGCRNRRRRDGFQRLQSTDGHPFSGVAVPLPGVEMAFMKSVRATRGERLIRHAITEDVITEGSTKVAFRTIVAVQRFRFDLP
jgi:hypothetical protein